jgi:hypothetical protein
VSFLYLRLFLARKKEKQYETVKRKYLLKFLNTYHSLKLNLESEMFTAAAFLRKFFKNS